MSFAKTLLLLAAALALAPSSLASQPLAQELAKKAIAQGLHLEKQWLRLHYYDAGVFGGYKSKAADPKFFLAADGKTNPEAELAATIEAFLSPETPPGRDSHPQCQFPARFQWAKEKLVSENPPWPKVQCEEYESWKSRMAAKSVSVVFSSYYLNNPSSAFGHSFLRINRASSDFNGVRFELLDYGINFAAEVTSNNALVYAIGGASGYFKGTYTATPYYYKVREYNDFEARDLWGYDLDLTDQEIQALVAHLWELGSTYFDYYFFTANCSYQILAALEASAPRLDITSRLRFYVIPADTIRTVNETPGLVKAVHYRPSIRAQFRHRLEALTGTESDALQDVVKNRTLQSGSLQDLPAPQQARVLDAAMDYVEMTEAAKLLERGSPASLWKQKLLIQRSKLLIRSDEMKLETPMAEAPHLGHTSARVSMGYAHEQSGGDFARLGIRFALHDLLDAPQGYPRGAEIEFMNVGLRYSDLGRQVQLDDLAVIKVTSLSPWNAFQKARSWRAMIGGRRIWDRNCDRCFAPAAEAGMGLSGSWTLGVPLVAYALIDGEIAYSSSFIGSKLRVGTGPELGAIFQFAESMGLWIKGGYRYLGFSYEPTYYQAGAALRWNLAKNISFEAESSRQLQEWENKIGAFFYY